MTAEIIQNGTNKRARGIKLVGDTAAQPVWV